ncbi:MAG: hypothetical protein HYU37_09480 [Acidobacteria bacterium]|nr:hypothetical protein [Acidobacteriota bacterium]
MSTTKTSPFSMKESCETPHVKLKSKRRALLAISTTALPLNRRGSAGRRTRIRVVYGAFGVRTVSRPSAGHSYTLARPLTKNSSSM